MSHLEDWKMGLGTSWGGWVWGGASVFFFWGGMELLSDFFGGLPRNGVVLCHIFLAMDCCFFFLLGAAIEENVDMSRKGYILDFFWAGFGGLVDLVL